MTNLQSWQNGLEYHAQSGKPDENFNKTTAVLAMDGQERKKQ